MPADTPFSFALKGMRMSEILTRREVKDYLRLSERTVYTITKSGELPSFRVGKTAVRYRKADIDAYIARQVEIAAAIAA